MATSANVLTQTAKGAYLVSHNKGPIGYADTVPGKERVPKMNLENPYATLPDMSARIMREALALEFNIDWDRFCADNHLSGLRLGENMTDLLARDEILLQQRFIEAVAQRPDIWFDVGLRYRSIKFGAMGIAMITARTLGEALEVASRYQPLTYSLFSYRYTVAPNGACALTAETGDLPAGVRAFTQHRDLGTVCTLVADMMAGGQVLERVTVAGLPPVNWAKVAKSFPCPVEFGADQTQWIFLPGSRDRPLPYSDKQLSLLYRSQCDDLLGRAYAATSVKHRLAMLLDRAAGQLLSAGEAARELALSERTLHRRLAEEGTRFSTIVDSARYQRTCALLTNERMSVERIAAEVGFAEPSSFARAFKRWSGMSAVEYRRSVRGIQVHRPN